jgi:hypothetical protein
MMIVSLLDLRKCTRCWLSDLCADLLGNGLSSIVSNICFKVFTVGGEFKNKALAIDMASSMLVIFRRPE